MAKPKHGMYGSPTYLSWANMIQRCTNPKHTRYPTHGARGITVCEKWLKFEGFLEDMGIRPEGLTIEREDNDKGYYKENCKWATYTSQNRNRSNSVMTDSLRCVIKDMVSLFSPEYPIATIVRNVANIFDVEEYHVSNCIRTKSWRSVR